MKVAPLRWNRGIRTSAGGRSPSLADYHRCAGTASWTARADNFGLIVLDDGGAGGCFRGLAATPGGSWLDHVVPADRGQVQRFLRRRPAGSLEYRLTRSDGGEMWIRHWLLAVPGNSRQLHGLVQAVSGRMRIEDECLEAEERERTRIGQELHDDICQVLAGLTYMMGVMSRRGKQRGESLPPEFDELHASLVAAMNRTRAMAHGLFPAQLADGTLRGALEELARQLQARFDFTLAVKTPAKMPAHGGETLTHVFRIAQEAMTNSLRHGGATTGEVVVRVQGGEIDLVLRDNGRGFAGTPAMAGAGLRAMGHRARLLGGSLEFGNRSAGGAYVRLLYPFPALTRRVQQAA